MPISHHLSVLALGPLVSGACRAVGFKAAEESLDGISRFLADRFLDQSQRLPEALRRASDRAWRGLEVALAGESLAHWLDRRDDKAFREQVRLFLSLAPSGDPTAHGPAFRAAALNELRSARKAGLLDGPLDVADLAVRTAPLARHADPVAQLNAEWGLLSELAEGLRGFGYAALAEFLALRPTSGRGDDRPLLVVAVRYFFRREVEADDALRHGLAFAQMEALASSQEAGFAGLSTLLAQVGDDLTGLMTDIRDEVAKLTEAVARLLEAHQLAHRPMRPQDSVSIRSDEERRFVAELVRRYRALPEPAREQEPRLLGDIGKLELAVGDFAAAERDFAAVADLVPTNAGKAEALYQGHLAALEQGRFEEALAALIEAANLDAARFEPFPLRKFEPLKILGAGGFGVAILCRNRRSEGKVVVKSLRTDGLDRSVADLFREARVLEDLDHPAVIRVRDCDFADAAETRPFLVMDYFDGSTLAEHVAAHGPLGVEEWLPLARAMAEGLQSAHAQGILHRDVKPANVLVRNGPNGWALKLIDFGLALRQEARNTQATRSLAGLGTLGGMTGTLDYAAPEQLGKLPGVSVGPPADVYGFGKTACFALFGTPNPLRKHWASVPEAVADLLESCLAEKPTDRPADFAAVLAKLAPPTKPELAKSAFWAKVPTATPPTSKRGDRDTRILQGHTGAVHDLAFTPDGRLLLTAGGDHTVRVWDAFSGRELRCLPGHKKAVYRVAIAPDGRRALTSSGDQTVRLWDIPTGQEVKCFDRQTNRSAAFAPDGRHALCGSLYDGKLRLWNVQTGKEVRRFPGHGDWVVCVAFAPDGRRAISGGLDKTIRLWDLTTGQQIRCITLKGEVLADIAVTPNGQQVLSAGSDRLVRVWDVTSGQELVGLVGHSDAVQGVATSPMGDFAASASRDGTVRLWDWRRGREVHRFPGETAPAHCVAFAPDASEVAAGCEDGTVWVWPSPA